MTDDAYTDPSVGQVSGVGIEPMRLTAGSRHAHCVAEARRVHALRVGDVSAGQRQTQHRLAVSLGPVADQLTAGDHAVALCPAQHALVVQVAGELDVLQTRHSAASAVLWLLLLYARSTSSTNQQHNSHSAVHTIQAKTERQE